MSLPRSADKNFQDDSKKKGKKKVVAKKSETKQQKSNHPTGGYVPPHARQGGNMALPGGRSF